MSKLLHPRKDEEAWETYPHLRSYFNKLDLALKLEYSAGPAGTPVPKDGNYIIRPIYNLAGLSAHTKILELKEGDTIEGSGLFWCELFKGEHLSVDYSTHKTEAYPQRCWKGHKSDTTVHYSKWTKVETKNLPDLKIPEFIQKDLASVFNFNVEYVGGKIIEIHLHHATWMPKEAQIVIPIWDDHENAMQQHMMWTEAGYTWVESEKEADGETKRLGFYYTRKLD